MRYIIANKQKALDAGFNEIGHTINGELICLTEKEVRFSPNLTGEFIERVASIDGVIANTEEALSVMGITKSNN